MSSLVPLSSSPRRRGPRASDGSSREWRPCIYILASRRNGTLYIGVTSNLARRVWEHRTKAIPSFTQRYDVQRLVFIEFHEAMENAIVREKQLKRWNRAWKLRLIEHQNPRWRDLYEDLTP